jgi:hypothetical protein
MRRLVILILLAGCAVDPTPSEGVVSEAVTLPIPPVPPVVVVLSPPVATLSQLTNKVAKEYHIAALRETLAIGAEDATAEYIKAVHTADIIAQGHISVLDDHSTRKEVSDASKAVRHLLDVIDQGPEAAK